MMQFGIQYRRCKRKKAVTCSILIHFIRIDGKGDRYIDPEGPRSKLRPSSISQLYQLTSSIHSSCCLLNCQHSNKHQSHCANHLADINQLLTRYVPADINTAKTIGGFESYMSYSDLQLVAAQWADCVGYPTRRTP